MVHERYQDQVRLLVRLLPVVAKERVFALKGGTAINLFYRNLPRLSVDIDLTYLPIKDRTVSLSEIDDAMDRIAAGANKLDNISAGRISGGGGGATRVQARSGAATVKIETSPVTRGVVFAVNDRRISPDVEEKFGFAETQMVSFEDLYGGKLHAALDRQHPRDLFDVKLLYENEGLTDDLFRAFLVYLASSNRPPHELLAPNLIDITDMYEKEFVGMTTEPVKFDELLDVRVRLVEDVQSRLTGSIAEFLQSLHNGDMNFDLIGLPNAADLPAIRWKQLNVQRFKQTDSKKHATHGAALKTLLK